MSEDIILAEVHIHAEAYEDLMWRNVVEVFKL